jgi:hypothetical protein
LSSRAIICCAIVSILMSGCALPTANSNPNECVGPPDYCTPYFG